MGWGRGDLRELGRGILGPPKSLGWELGLPHYTCEPPCPAPLGHCLLPKDSSFLPPGAPLPPKAMPACQSPSLQASLECLTKQQEVVQERCPVQSLDSATRWALTTPRALHPAPQLRVK